ncbi:hypothetical protein BC826DRAFT_1164338 [Russula brevipes]|nr:hypothetical protein BC826DRAFT_1164338 [Russula brevipes]
MSGGNRRLSPLLYSFIRWFMGYNKRPKDFRTLDLDETRGPTGHFVATFRLSFPQKPHQDKPSDMRRVGATFCQRRQEAIIKPRCPLFRGTRWKVGSPTCDIRTRPASAKQCHGKCLRARELRWFFNVRDFISGPSILTSVRRRGKKKLLEGPIMCRGHYDIPCTQIVVRGGNIKAIVYVLGVRVQGVRLVRMHFLLRNSLIDPGVMSFVVQAKQVL